MSSREAAVEIVITLFAVRSFGMSVMEPMETGRESPGLRTHSDCGRSQAAHAYPAAGLTLARIGGPLRFRFGP